MKIIPGFDLFQKLAQSSGQATGWAMTLGVMGASILAWLFAELVVRLGGRIVRLGMFLSREDDQ